MAVVREAGRAYRRHIRHRLTSPTMNVDLAADVNVLYSIGSRLSRVEADARSAKTYADRRRPATPVDQSNP